MYERLRRYLPAWLAIFCTGLWYYILIFLILTASRHFDQAEFVYVDI